MGKIWMGISQGMIIAALLVLIGLLGIVIRLLRARAALEKAPEPEKGLRPEPGPPEAEPSEPERGLRPEPGPLEAEPSEPEKGLRPEPGPLEAEPSEPERGLWPESRSERRLPSASALPEPEKIYLKCGLAVDKAIGYNPDGPVRFQETPEEKADFLLCSDMTVRPSRSCFDGFNSISYFTSRYFTLVYELQNRAGNKLEPERTGRMLRCLKLGKPARVSDCGNRYILKETGIQIMEER